VRLAVSRIAPPSTKPATPCFTHSPPAVAAAAQAQANLRRRNRRSPQLNYAKDSLAAILADGTRLRVSRSGYARLPEAMGDPQRGGGLV